MGNSRAAVCAKSALARWMRNQRATRIAAFVFGACIAIGAGPRDEPAPLPPLPPEPALPASAASSLGSPLVPDQVIRPIDLPSVLRLAGARDLDIAIARERVHAALAELEQARVLWLPSIYIGPNWIRHDGQAQEVGGRVSTISKSSLFLGTTAAGGSSISGPVPAGGPAQVTGLTSILRISDAIYAPLAARQVLQAKQAGVQTANNDALLAAAEAYLELQQFAGRLAIAREAFANASRLSRLTESFARGGAGLEADHARSLAERDRRGKELEALVGPLEAASAELIRVLHLDPRILVAPVEPAESVLQLVRGDCSLDELITTGLRNRPELGEAQFLVRATLVRLKEAKLRPLIPSLAFRYSGGGFGGGINGFFGDFASRSDVDVNLFWELQHLGIADRAIAKQRAAENREAALRLLKVQDRVASEVVRAEKFRLSASRQIVEASRAVPEAVRSLSINFTSIQKGAGLPGATRPIEVLQPIQALAQARSDYLDAVLAYNRAQFRLYHAIGRAPSPAAADPSRHVGNGSRQPARTEATSPALAGAGRTR